jgi:hypothetical protein
MKRVIRSDKPVTLLLLLWSHKCDFGSERVKDVCECAILIREEIVMLSLAQILTLMGVTFSTIKQTQLKIEFTRKKTENMFKNEWGSLSLKAKASC